ncbi:hypothetical protein [Streptomyces marianii]|uniref:Uncharacterized protein n=1 Tax=Streptomyces marianii TaxID=1817406 RepID=A0A5R9DR29_9ACTN|nr:hypothetical protein [Streptomyces marianii]TLQ38949.1 hypothetical protein FEF34_39700 [Streptomyces marianii]
MGYDRQRAAIGYATSQLTALSGTRPRVVEESGAVRIETDVTARLLRHWQQLLAVLDLGTTFGLTDTHTGQVAWLRFEFGESSRP